MFEIQVTGEWAGKLGGWRPAVDGTANQTGEPAEEASRFSTFEAAQDCLNAMSGDAAHRGQFRIVEVAETPVMTMVPTVWSAEVFVGGIWVVRRGGLDRSEAAALARVYARRGDRARIAEYLADEGTSAICAIEVEP